MINISNINAETFAQYDNQIGDNQCTKEELNLFAYDLVATKNNYYNYKKMYKVARPLKLSIVSTLKCTLLN